MTKVRARAVVLATGAIEQPAVFRNNDLPGVLLGFGGAAPAASASPSRRADAWCILTANREGYETARALRAHGIELAAVLDLRAGAGSRCGGSRRRTLP